MRKQFGEFILRCVRLTDNQQNAQKQHNFTRDRLKHLDLRMHSMGERIKEALMDLSNLEKRLVELESQPHRKKK